MKHLIYCSQNGYECEIEVPSLNIDDITEALSDIIDDCIHEELGDAVSCPCGFFPDPDEIASTMYSNVRKRLHQKFASISFYRQTIAADGSTISSSLIDIDYVIEALIERRECCEQSYCDAGPLIIRMLTKFLNSGIWQFGLRREDGSFLSDATQWPEPTTNGISVSWTRSKEMKSPIIWFGIEGDDPIECWSITLDETMFELLNCYETPYSTKPRLIERWKSFWFCSFWSFNWNALFDNNGYNYITWMFAECGMDEPEDELDRIRKSCPIVLDATDTREVLVKKIMSFFLGKYNETMKGG